VVLSRKVLEQLCEVLIVTDKYLTLETPKQRYVVWHDGLPSYFTSALNVSLFAHANERRTCVSLMSTDNRLEGVHQATVDRLNQLQDALLA
jgi:hypothetical protein